MSCSICNIFSNKIQVFTVRFGPSNSLAGALWIAPSQKPQSMMPSTAGWLKKRVIRFSRATAFLLASFSDTVSSVIQILSPASATLSSLYCNIVFQFLSKMVLSSVILENHTWLKDIYLNYIDVYIAAMKMTLNSNKRDRNTHIE